MSKRDFFGDPSDNDDGPASKMRKFDESDDGGGSGRTGRVRKKSAKVLEMEEFEQAEKTSSVVKKTKTPKGAPVPGNEGDLTDVTKSSKKSKAASSAVGLLLESTPVSRKGASLDASRAVPAELSLRTPPTAMMISSMDTVSQVHIQEEVKPDTGSLAPSLLSTVLPSVTAVKQEDPKSVIKYLLSSPTAGSTHQISTGIMQPTSHESPAPSKKSSKKIKLEDKSSSTPKAKEKKVKIEIMSPSELGPPVLSMPTTESKGPGLKMKIMSGSNPMTAQVALESSDSGAGQTPKPKKAPKKAKPPVETDDDMKLEIAGIGDEEKVPKKKKVSKKKEKLIQDAISAAKQMPNLAALVASPHSQVMGLGDSPSPTVKQSKKKTKSSSSPGAAKKDVNTSDSLVMDFDDADLDEDEAGESTLVIAETEKKKKKHTGKKKGQKEKDESASPKEEKAKKIPKRAPTAYMLFCNTHRPSIVADNPGIAFAGISRKLGELWQTQSNKQKLQWRRKAQRRLKKSNLISTGKAGTQGGPSASTAAGGGFQEVATLNSTNQKLALMLQKSKSVALDEGPLSPTKVGIDIGMENDGYSFSIEPLDVSAHLKLLGESLSIIGMRLQEHKGMIAVQGSLSVLLDSLLCACGPLLCLTQQVPGMDGCSPLVHAQTLDSIAYVMPGL